MSERAYYCEACNEPGDWLLTRIGDVVCTWVCREHLRSEVFERLQRGGEVTKIVVQHSSFFAQIEAEEVLRAASSPERESE